MTGYDEATRHLRELIHTTRMRHERELAPLYAELARYEAMRPAPRLTLSVADFGDHTSMLQNALDVQRGEAVRARGGA